MTTLACTSSTITLPGDIPWIDEGKWSPVGQQWERTLGGVNVGEIRPLVLGQPITLAGDKATGWIDRATFLALQAAEAAQGDTPFTLTLSDGRTFTVVFFGGGSTPAVAGDLIAVQNTDGTFVAGVTPQTSDQLAAAFYWVVVKMITVG